MGCEGQWPRFKSLGESFTHIYTQIRLEQNVYFVKKIIIKKKKKKRPLTRQRMKQRQIQNPRAQTNEAFIWA